MWTKLFVPMIFFTDFLLVIIENCSSHGLSKWGERVVNENVTFFLSNWTKFILSHLSSQKQQKADIKVIVCTFFFINIAFLSCKWCKLKECRKSLLFLTCKNGGNFNVDKAFCAHELLY
jgi:hypothetical protein